MRCYTVAMFYHGPTNWILRGIFALGIVSAFFMALMAPDAFSTRFATEDGPIEYATAILLFAASLILGYLCYLSRRWLVALYALAFFFAAGEEVSWGQRIFGIESSEFFAQNNFQGETNLHNLVVGETHLTEFIFGTGLALIIMSYLVVLPLLYPVAGWVRRFCEFLAVPVPQKHIGALAVFATLFSAWIGLDRQWEVYEFAFGVFVCLIFLNPVNAETFGLSRLKPAAPSS